MSSQTTRQQAEYKAEGDDTDIDDGIALEPSTVADVQHVIEKDDANDRKARGAGKQKP